MKVLVLLAGLGFVVWALSIQTLLEAMKLGLFCMEIK